MDPLRNIPRLSELSSLLLCLPTTDRGTFATLTSVSDIQEWTRSKADEYRQFALALLALHNLAAPIHRLPTEVLERILEQCWQDWKSLRLPHVCCLWRSILLGRTAFWADAVADCELPEKRDVARDEHPLIDALLSRSTQHAHTIKPSFYTFPRSIAESLTPYISNVVSLQVAVGRGDLQGGLWPVLLSGMPNLEALEIQLTITEEDLSRYNERDHGDLGNYHSRGWITLPMLSHKALPKLSRLTCPHNMVEPFGDVSLRHLTVRCIDRSQHSLVMPATALGKPRGLHLEPYRDCLETLEIMPTWFQDVDPHAPALPKPLELPSLRVLRLTSHDEVASPILSWLLLPQTAFIHIIGFSDIPSGTKLRSIVSTIDRVGLQQVAARRQGQWTDYRMQCFVSDRERLRIDDFAVFESSLLPVFGENAPVTHLKLSVVSQKSGAGGLRGIDLHAFPHLVHLDVSGSDTTDTVALMLQPDLHSHRRRAGQAEAAESSPPCLRLTKLVIACGSLVRSTSGGRSTSLLPGSDLGADVDELFQQQCAVLQQALADRASHGIRLTHLTLRLRPRLELSDSACRTVADIGADEPGDRWQQQKVDRKEEAGCSGGLEDVPDSGSNDTADNGAAESTTIWPSRTTRQSVLQSLQELVDGPVVLKLLDSAGAK